MAATNKFTNNAITKLAGSLTAVATSYSVTTGDGAKFPALTGSNWFQCTLVKIVGGVAQLEIVRVTARSGDIFTCTRAQEGTTALSFSAGDVVELRMTAGFLNDEVVKKGDDNTISGNNTHTGDITMSGASFIEAEGAAVASAATTNIWTTTDGNTKHITGTTTITSFGTAPQAGAWMKLIFDDALTLTHSANLNLNNNGLNVTVAAGDMAAVYADTTTQFDVFIQRANGQPVADIAPSALTLLATLTPTAVANLDSLTVVTSNYDNVCIAFNGVRPASGTPNLRMQVANAGVVDTGSVYNYEIGAANNAVNTSTSFLLSNAPSSAGLYHSGLVELWNVRGASGVSKAGRVTAACGAAANADMTHNTLQYSGAAISGFRFFWSGGQNFDTVGKIYIYGYRNA